LQFHRSLAACDVFVVLSDFKPHYFAGYSNPAKYYLPGLTSLESARGNHSWALDSRSAAGRHPWHPDPTRRDNPVALDMVEALEILSSGRSHFAVATVTGGEQLLWAGGGRSEEVSGRAMQAADRFTTLSVEPTRYLVVSNGGTPYDESLYAAQRALELTRGALLEGGEVLWLAECTNGIGPGASRENFFEPLSRPLEEVLKIGREGYILYSHKAWKFADYLRGTSGVYLCSELPESEVRRIHLRAAGEPQSVVDRWVAEADEGDGIRFIDDASRLLVRGI
jgi:nickel-dependent lactate racemase